MGAWADDPFGNDTACDWAGDLAEHRKGFFGNPGLKFIAATLDKVLDTGDEYIEAPDADEGIAAADTLARLRGHFYVRNSYTKSLDEWVAKQSVEVPQELIDRAIRVVDRILTPPSEALELWDETGEDGWKNQLIALKDRLQLPQ